jgi:hypothetical protein
LTIDQSLLAEFFKMRSENPFCSRDVPLVPRTVTSFVTADQQDGVTLRIERVDDPERPPIGLKAKLTKRVSRCPE